MGPSVSCAPSSVQITAKGANRVLYPEYQFVGAAIAVTQVANEATGHSWCLTRPLTAGGSETSALHRILPCRRGSLTTSYAARLDP